MSLSRLKGTEESVEIYDSETGVGVATLTRIINDSCEIMFALKMYWSVYDSLNIFDDIPGFDFNLRLSEYLRTDRIPFMTEYLPPKGREDSYALMLSVGLDMSYDMWAYMIEQGRVCQDDWRVRRIPGQVYEHDKYRIKSKEC